MSAEPVVPVESVAREVHHNYPLAETTPGNIIPRIAVERPTETAQQPIDSAARLAAIPSPTGRLAQGTRSETREEIFQVIAVAPAPAIA